MPALVVAHRGASGHRPEHSREAYLLGIALGADAVEPDVVLSSDGVPVVRHENEISGTTDVAEHPEFAGRRTARIVDGELVEGWFAEDFTWQELQALSVRERLPELRPESAAHDGGRILRLGEVLEICEVSSRKGRPVTVVIELKHVAHLEASGADPVAAVRAELERVGWLERQDRIVFESFEPAALDRVAEAVPLAPRILLLEETRLEDDDLDAFRGRFDGISVDKRMLVGEDHDGPELVRRAHERGLTVLTWTLRPENEFLEPRFRVGAPHEHGEWEREFEEVLETGVDGVFADHPDLVGRILGVVPSA